ncbi:AP2 associated protein kinase 1 [Echinococcus multilocularis]|uniref:non-specific serine/threonine protein kinase n=1 Tax=Echinococcus multilocularis TaxID=6211 RepID=A0A087VZP9_ECHMU|nr:AP2 associated protein kinase 1 [Echinococcus multilocularis]
MRPLSASCCRSPCKVAFRAKERRFEGFMRKILALLSHNDPDLGPTHLSVAGSGGGGSGVGSSSSVGLLPGKQVAIDNQRFTVDSVVAEGGFGIVYRVRSPDGRHFALKRTLVNNEVDLANIKREITIVSSLSHKNIINYVASKVIERESEIYEVLLLTTYYPATVSQVLAERQQKGLRFLEVEILRILTDVCEAISRLHHCETPIIHRDLKIENLLIDSRRNVVLCDFGSATSRILHPAKHGTLRCQEEIEKYTTLAYRAPEMVDLYSGVAVGPPADIWALGCVLYGLCFFALPFGSGSALAIQTGRYTVPASAATSYSSRLLKLMHYMLTISGAERPDIYQVAALAFSLLGRPNPVQNVNSRRVPQWQNLSLPTTGLMDASSKSSLFSHPIASSITTVNSSGEFAQAIRTSAISTLTTTETSVTTPTKTHAVSPSIARRRPRAVMNPPSTMRTTPVGGDSGGEPLPILAKPPNPPHSSTAFQNFIHSEGLLKPSQQPFDFTTSTKSSPLHRVGHRRGLSEASALLSNASSVRQTYSLGDLQRNYKSTNAKCATLRARVIFSAANDIDGDLFGAAFDAIRNHGGSTRKQRNDMGRSSVTGQNKLD